MYLVIDYITIKYMGVHKMYKTQLHYLEVIVDSDEDTAMSLAIVSSAAQVFTLLERVKNRLENDNTLCSILMDKAILEFAKTAKNALASVDINCDILQVDMGRFNKYRQIVLRDNITMLDIVTININGNELFEHITHFKQKDTDD